MTKKTEKKQRIIALHYHPQAIKALLHELKEGSKDNEPSYNLLTDVEELVLWALQKLPLVPPPDKEPVQGEPHTGKETD